jgi:hypothetical protein
MKHSGQYKIETQEHDYTNNPSRGLTLEAVNIFQVNEI